jgi:hypothetical protein
MNYHIKRITFDDADDNADIDVATLPQTWTTQRAWEMGFKNWQSQQYWGLKALGIERFGRWQDFKIYVNTDHKGDVDKAAFIDVNGNTASTGDWDYSHFQIPRDGDTDPTVSDIAMMASPSGSFPGYSVTALLNELENSLENPTEDLAIDSGANVSLFSRLSSHASDTELLHAVTEDLETENDYPPYSTNKVMGAGTAGAGRPSSPWKVNGCMLLGDNSQQATLPGFVAPCGLLMIETKSSTDGNSIGCLIELAAGSYKGVKAMPMQGGYSGKYPFRDLLA